MTARELPLYQCHKQVRALKIKDVTVHAHPDPGADDAAFQASEAFQGAHLFPEDANHPPIAVDAAWYRKHGPRPGGYYVLYEDGYTSYSPAQAFETGYTPVAARGPLIGLPSRREQLEMLLVQGAASYLAASPSHADQIGKGINTLLDALTNPSAPAGQ